MNFHRRKPRQAPDEIEASTPEEIRAVEDRARAGEFITLGMRPNPFVGGWLIRVQRPPKEKPEGTLL